MFTSYKVSYVLRPAFPLFGQNVQHVIFQKANQDQPKNNIFVAHEDIMEYLINLVSNDVTRSRAKLNGT